MRSTARWLTGPLMYRTARECRVRSPRPASPFARTALLLCVTLSATHTGLAQALDDGDGTLVTCDEYNSYGNPYFGDTHVHTIYSVDAFVQGTNTTPDQAYRFAKKEPISFQPIDDPRIREIDRPLDFAIVTDHAELFGERAICTDETHPLYDDPLTEDYCPQLRLQDGSALVQWNLVLGAPQSAVARFSWCGPDGSTCTSQLGDTWQDIQNAAAIHYDTSSDCSFTTFVGYEWTGAPLTSGTGRGIEIQNMHRNVVFRNSIVPDRPFTYLDNGYPEQLWNSLQEECLDLVHASGKCDVIAIPHNSNLSQGRIFALKLPDGAPYGLAKARQRKRFEPLIEIMQHKGQSECLATSSDELCDFETVPWGHLGGNFINPTEPQVEGTVRYALKQGLVVRDTLGQNPFEYGLIGSTDTHLGAPGHVEEQVGYLGHGGAAGGAGGTTVYEGISDTPEFNPGGLAVVWAPQNSRAALFDAMKRREVYATSGPRHIVRFYGGWDLPSDICEQLEPVQFAQDNNAVPMGGTIRAPANGNNPKFFVYALKDGGTAGNPGYDFQRVQIIKGWVDDLGVTQEAVIDIAVDPLNTAGVDPDSCAVTGSGGFPSACQFWEDTSFEPTQRAFYYARVVENPSCRWSQRQCLAADPPIDCAGTVPAEYAACCDAAIPKTVQERSWTSPIWYEKSPPSGC